MPKTLSNRLVVAISSRALFDLDASHKIFEEQGVDAYCQYQIDHETEVLEPGVAFHMVEKLLKLQNQQTGEPFVEVTLLSRNSADTGLRIFNSIHHYDLPITRAAFTNGASTSRYVSAFSADLFLSANHDDVRQALNTGFAAATILSQRGNNNRKDELRIAFDGDSVIFSDEAEQVYQRDGLDAFHEQEILNAKKPLSGGPFKPFLAALHQIQQQYPADTCPIRTALITARSAPSHERVIQTLRSWNIRIDEALFLGGLAKGEFLKAFDADFFFDDQKVHCESASEHVATGHVPHGITNAKA